jgi:hypothetical protein
VILFGIGGAYGLRRVAATGGVPEPVTTPDVRRSETSHRWPCFLPDGRHFLYLVLAGASSSIWAGSLGGEKRELLLDTFSAPIYAESGHLLFVRDGALRAQAFDAAALRLIGEPLTLAEPVQADTNLWAHTPVSVGGDILAYRGGRIGTVQLTWVDRGGRELGTLGPPGDYHDLALSPDGGKLVTSDQEANHLVMADLATRTLRRFTFKPERVTRSNWSPDGRFIAYDSTRNGAFSIFIVPATGAGTEESLDSIGDARNPVFSPDGRFLLYEKSSDPKTQYDLWMVPLSGDRKPRPFLRTEANEAHPVFSPNGRWVAYTADMSGRAEVYVRAFPNGEGPWQISTEGGDEAVWRGDGFELFYVSPARRMMAADVNAEGGAFRASPPKTLFRARMRPPGIVSVRNDYIALPDGKRFLIDKLVEDPAKGTITVVLDWTSKLAR